MEKKSLIMNIVRINNPSTLTTKSGRKKNNGKKH
jgi:hypothetical protein